MRMFSVKNDKTYTKEYYRLLRDVFFAETKGDATEEAKRKLEGGGLRGAFELEEFGDTEYHCVDGIKCGKLEPFKECAYSPAGWGVVYRCQNCKEEIDDSQGELFCKD